MYEPLATNNAYKTQRFYLSYHDFDQINNKFYCNYPFANVDVGGILIWHTPTDSIGFLDTFENWKTMPIDIECAHGKTNWTVTNDNVVNEGTENSLTGRDKLEIRLVEGQNEIAGPYFGTDKGDGSVFYTPGYNQEFSFRSNPNSNLISNNETLDYSQSNVTGFTVSNIRKSGSNVLVNIKLNDYTVNINTTLTEGKWYFDNSITVNSGAVLTINAGVEIIFKEGCSLIVNGTVNILGASQNPVVFTCSKSNPNRGDWEGINLNFGSTANINYINVNYAENGILCDDAECTVNNSVFNDCISGIATCNTAIDEVQINNCTFNRNEFGVMSGGGNPIIFNSSFFDNGNALFCWSGNAYLGIGEDYGNNYFLGNYETILAYDLSYVFLGRNTCTMQGGNNVFANDPNVSSHLQSLNYSTILAENNYWGVPSPDLPNYANWFFISDATSSIDYIPYLTSAPSKSLNLVGSPEETIYNSNMKLSTGNSEFQDEKGIDNYNPEWPLDWKLMYCRNLVSIKKYPKAKNLLKQIIRENIDSNQCYFALNLLKQSSFDDNEGLLNFYNNSLNGNSKFAQTAAIYLSDLKGQNTPDVVNNILANPNITNNNKEFALSALTIYYFYKGKNIPKAREIFCELMLEFPKSKILKPLSTLLRLNNDKSFNKDGSSNITNPLEYKLYSNYPNPFNR